MTRKLLATYLRARTVEARNALVEAVLVDFEDHFGAARRAMPLRGAALDDARAAAMASVVAAAESYEPRRGGFEAWVRLQMRSAILGDQRDCQVIPRGPRARGAAAANPDHLPSPGHGTDGRAEAAAMVNELLEATPERGWCHTDRDMRGVQRRRIVYDYYIRGRAMCELAAELEVTESAVSQVLSSWRAWARRHMEGDE